MQPMGHVDISELIAIAAVDVIQIVLRRVCCALLRLWAAISSARWSAKMPKLQSVLVSILCRSLITELVYRIRILSFKFRHMTLLTACKMGSGSCRALLVGQVSSSLRTH
jgi:hypothetical protein